MKQTFTLVGCALGALLGLGQPAWATSSRSSKNLTVVDPHGHVVVFPHKIGSDVVLVDRYIHDNFGDHKVVFLGRHLTLLDTWRRIHDSDNNFVLPLSKAEALPGIDSKRRQQMFEHFKMHLPARDSIADSPILVVDTVSGSWRKLRLAYRFFLDFLTWDGWKNPVDLLALPYKLDRAIATRWSKEERNHLHQFDLRVNAPALAKSLRNPQNMDALSLFGANPADRSSSEILMPRKENRWLAETLIQKGYLLELANELE